MGMTPKVNHSKFEFNLMFLTLGIYTTEGTKTNNEAKKINERSRVFSDFYVTRAFLIPTINTIGLYVLACRSCQNVRQ